MTHLVSVTNVPAVESESALAADASAPSQRPWSDSATTTSADGAEIAIAGTEVAIAGAEGTVEVIDLRVPGPNRKNSAAHVPATNVQRRLQENEHFGLLASGAATPSERERAMHALVLLHKGLVEHIARKFRDRGEPLEDLVQVGMIGLLKAVQRFDISREVEFSTYATVTITGEIKRHFRDRTWAVHMPRSLQELRMQVSQATDLLTQTQGRPPSTEDIALHLEVTVSDVVQGQLSARAYASISLDALMYRPDGSIGELSEFARDDHDLERVDIRETLRPLLAALPERECQIVLWHFIEGCSQTTIAQRLGISQMHVSRLLNRAIGRMRSHAGVNERGGTRRGVL